MISIIFNIIGFMQSIFLGTLLIISGSGKETNRHHLVGGFLILVFAIPIFNSIRVLFLGAEFMSDYQLWSNFSLLLIGPLLFLYTRGRTMNKRLEWKDLLHFLPFLILLPLELICRAVDSQLAIAVEVFSAIFLVISMTIYLILTIKSVRTKKGTIEGSLIFTIYGFALIWHVNLVIQIAELFSERFREEYLIFSTLLLSVLVVILCYTHWIELLKKLNPVKSKITLTIGRAASILKKIKAEMDVNKPFLQKDLTLQKLSAKIGEPSSYVSHIINSEMKMSFPKYIARLRVQEFVLRLNEDKKPHLTIFAMAEEVGFKSPSTFNKAFKEAKNMLPSEYIKSLKKG